MELYSDYALMESAETVLAINRWGPLVCLCDVITDLEKYCKMRERFVSLLRGGWYSGWYHWFTELGIVTSERNVWYGNKWFELRRAREGRPERMREPWKPIRQHRFMLVLEPMFTLLLKVQQLALIKPFIYYWSKTSNLALLKIIFTLKWFNFPFIAKLLRFDYVI